MVWINWKKVWRIILRDWVLSTSTSKKSSLAISTGPLCTKIPYSGVIISQTLKKMISRYIFSPWTVFLVFIFHFSALTSLSDSASFCIKKYKVSVILMDNLLSQILRVLLTILDTSSDPRALAVACFDLSQFIQYHPAGRVIVTDLKAKERVMKLMNHENTEVTKSALLCIQRLFLGAKYASFLQAWILFLWGPVLFTKEMLVMIWFQFGCA